MEPLRNSPGGIPTNSIPSKTTVSPTRIPTGPGGAPVVENLCQSRRGQEGKGAAKGDRQVGEWFHGMVLLGGSLAQSGCLTEPVDRWGRAGSAPSRPLPFDFRVGPAQVEGAQVRGPGPFPAAGLWPKGPGIPGASAHRETGEHVTYEGPTVATWVSNVAHSPCSADSCLRTAVRGPAPRPIGNRAC